MSNHPTYIQRNNAPDEQSAVPTESVPLFSAPPTVTVTTVREANFKIDLPYTSEGYAFDTSAPSVAMPAGTADQIRAALRDTPNLKPDEDMDPVTQKYVEVTNSALSSLPYANGYVATAARPTAMWTQQVPSASGPLMGYTPKFKKKEGVKYTGESARNLIRSALKLGTVKGVPLWHSGFWATFSTPSEAELLELYRKITQEKITLGRSTYGLMFSNTSAYTNKIMLDFAIAHLYETSIILKDDDDIRNYIQLPDLSLLIWGMACATWPNGFQYQRACITDIDKCKHIVQEKLSLDRLLVTDLSSLTERQIQHMTSRQRGSMTTDSVKSYTDDFLRGKATKVAITDTLSISLRMPTAAAHVDAGYKWISRIEEEYGRAMTMDDNARNDYLMQHAQATAMRQYSHFVTAIHADEDEVDGASEILNSLNDMSAHDEIRNTFMKKVADYLDEAVVSIIAIPTYTCPACGGDQRHTHEGEKFPELIPLDVAQTFFPLLVQKILRIQMR